MEIIGNIIRESAIPLLSGVAISLLLIFFDSLLGSPGERFFDKFFGPTIEDRIKRILKEAPTLTRKDAERIILKVDTEMKEEEDAARRNRLVILLASIGGIVGLILTIWKWDRVLKLLGVELNSDSSWDIFAMRAMAAPSEPRPELAVVLPYIAAGILAMMGLSFVIALCILMFVPDTKENQARIKSADNIVKTFGGFFTGLATTLLK